MIYKINLSKQANSDLRSIYEYIAFSLLSPDNAQKQLKRLETGILNLESLPKRFKVYPHEPWRSRNIRIMPIDNFLIFYISDDSTQTVSILRVIYSGQNIPDNLNI